MEIGEGRFFAGSKLERLLQPRRNSAGGTFIKWRYLATVRRATITPWSASILAKLTSDSGSLLLSFAIISFRRARTAAAEQVPPLSVMSSRGKKCLNSKMPRGVDMYLLPVAREIVDS